MLPKGKDNVVVGTDQNIDFVSLKRFAPADELLEFTLKNYYLPTITRPTRVTHETAILIDNLYVKTKSYKENKANIILEDISDHYPCLVQLEICKNQLGESYFTHRKLNQVAYDNINHDLLQFDWESLNDLDANRYYDRFISIIQRTFDSHAPQIEVGISNQSMFREPWMTVAISKYTRKCKKLFKRFRSSNLEADRLRYVKYQTTLNRIKRFEKKKFYDELFKKHGDNVRSMWNVLNSLIKGRRHKLDIPMLLYKGSEVTNPREIVENINEHFVTAGERVQSSIPPTKKDPLDYVNACHEYISDVKTSEVEISNIISNMKDKTSSGIDGISNQMLKHIQFSIRRPLTILMNKSLCSGQVPNGMKIAKVIPLLKSGTTSDCDNFRPISLLPVISKILEKIVFKRVMQHCESNGIMYYRQYGYRKNRSTSDAIYDLIGELVSNLDKKFHILSVFIDLKKAYDTCSHDTIIQKLKKLGISGSLLEWFKCYLTGRSQYLSFNNYESCFRDIVIGYPQGSLMGVLLFNLTINDLHRCLRYANGILYADDTTIFVMGQNIKHLKTKLQSDLRSLSEWLQANKLKLNVKKTKVMIFSRDVIFEDVDLKIDNELIEVVNEFKFLGVWLDNRLSFLKHCEYVASNLIKTIYISQKVNFLSQKHLKCIYNAHFNSRLTYAAGAWGTLLSKDQYNCIYKLQKRMLRIVCKKPFNSHTTPLFHVMKILMFKDLIQLCNLKVTFHVLEDSIGKGIINHFEFSNYRTSRNKNLIIRKHRSKLMNNCFIVKCVTLWNGLPMSIKSKANLYNFKKVVKLNMLSKYI